MPLVTRIPGRAKVVNKKKRSVKNIRRDLANAGKRWKKLS
jgi:hypothetical protein